MLDINKMEPLQVSGRKLLRLQAIIPLVRVWDSMVSLDMLLTLTDKSLDDLRVAKTWSEISQGDYLGSAAVLENFTSPLTAYVDELAITLTRRTKLLNNSRLIGKTKKRNEYGFTPFKHVRYCRNASAVLQGDGVANAVTYPLLRPNASQTDKETWLEHRDDADYMNKKLLIPFISSLNNSEYTSLYYWMVSYELLPINIQEDVDPLNLPDLINNFGGGWSVVTLLFGLLFVAGEWNTRVPRAFLQLKWWRKWLTLLRQACSGLRGRCKSPNNDESVAAVTTPDEEEIKAPDVDEGTTDVHAAPPKARPCQLPVRFETLEHKLKGKVPDIERRLEALERLLERLEARLPRLHQVPSAE